MIDPIPAPDHVAAFQVSGTITADDYDRVIPAIEEKLSRYQTIGVLADLTELHALTVDAIRRDIQYGLSKIKDLHRFKHVSVVSDEQWAESATELIDTLLPQVDARVFLENEFDDAMAWATSSQ